MTIISPDFTSTDFVEADNSGLRAQLTASRDKFAIPPGAITCAIAFAIEPAADVDVNEIVIRHTEQG